MEGFSLPADMVVGGIGARMYARLAVAVVALEPSCRAGLSSIFCAKQASLLVALEVVHLCASLAPTAARTCGDPITVAHVRDQYQSGCAAARACSALRNPSCASIKRDHLCAYLSPTLVEMTYVALPI